MNVNAKYDDDKINPFMNDRCKCEWFIGPEIPSYAWLPHMPRAGEKNTGPLISFIIHICCHIHIAYKWNLSCKCVCKVLDNKFI